MNSPPFTITPDAEERLKSVRSIPGMEPGICRSLRYEARKDGELTEEYSGEHFFIGFNPGAVWASAYPGAVRVTIAGREFWIVSDAAESLRGKELALVSKEVGQGSKLGLAKPILVAQDITPSPA